MSRRGSAASWRPSTAHRTSEKSVNTCEELSLCSRCKEKIGPQSGQKVMLKEYLKSIEYINSCHSLLNQIVAKQDFQNNFTLPDIPNFVNVFSIVYNQFAGEGKKSELETFATENCFKRHELDNIESLDEIYSRIDSLDAEEDLIIQKKYEEAKNAAGSGIPRPVSCEKSRVSLDEKVKQHNASGREVRCAGSERSAVGRVNRKRIIRHENKAVMLERSKNKYSGELSEDDLDKYAKELLRSRSESPSTPRSLSSNSRSGSPDIISRTRKTPNVSTTRTMTVRQKLKNNSTPPKITYKLQQKMSPTLNEKLDSMKNELNENKRGESESILSIRNKTSKFKINEVSDAEEKLHEESDGQDTVISPSLMRMKTIEIKTSEHPEKRLENDNPSELISKQTLDDKPIIDNPMCDELTKQQQCFIDKQMEFEKKRQFLNEKLLELERMPECNLDVKQSKHRQQLLKEKFIEDVKKQFFPDSDEDVDTEGDVKTNNLESDDIGEEDVVEKKSMNSVRSSKPEHLSGVNNTYNLLKMSISKPYRTKSVLSNIGVLMNSSKSTTDKNLKPEMKPKSSLPKDKQNSPFRQPRNRLREMNAINNGRIRIGSNFSSPSSEIKSDEEEIRSRIAEGHTYRNKF